MITREQQRMKIQFRDRFLERLSKLQELRGDSSVDEWVHNEREGMRRWASEAAHREFTLAEIERVENMAVGHTDYSSKFCLYVAELVVRQRT